MVLTLGVDSGTQSTKVVVCDPEGSIIGSARAPHPPGCVQPPEAWWRALVMACADLPSHLLTDVAALAVGAQQHGCVPLGPGPSHRVLGPASLWCDTSSAPEAARLNELADFVSITGSRLVASFTITKLAGLPAETAAACLPHDYLTWRLSGRLCTDRGDASGSGWWSPAGGVERRLLALAGRPDLVVPEVCGPDLAAGELMRGPAGELGLTPGIPVGVGTGDNMAAALGVGLREGEAVVSLGTSGTVCAISPDPVRDGSGQVSGFADATGRYLPLVCTLNCTRPVEVMARLLGLDLGDALDRAGVATAVTMLPYLLGERTPDLPWASGALVGLREETTPGQLLAAAVRGSAFGLAMGIEALMRAGVPAPRGLLVVGGGARHPTWRHAVADATALPVSRPAGVDHAARGMAAQARAVLEGAPVAAVAAAWRPSALDPVDPAGDTEADRHRELLQALEPVWRR